MMEIEISDAKQRVLDMAETFFMERGYNVVTLRDIADELGMRQASLYYHFPDGKEQLYVEVAERAFQRHRVGMEAAIDRAGQDLAQQLRLIAEWFGSQPQMSLASIMHSDVPALSEAGSHQLMNSAYTCIYRPIRAAFAESHQRGETRNVNPDVLTGAFLAIMDGIVFSGNRPGIPTREEMVDDVISVLLDGLRTPAQLA